jgi:uncharacterized protein
MNIIESNIDQIETLCKTHNVKELFAFGSVLTNDFNETSDIDLIVDFNNIKLEEYADNYFALKFALEEIFSRDVDLLEEKALINTYFIENIKNQKRLIYGN